MRRMVIAGFLVNDPWPHTNRGPTQTVRTRRAVFQRFVWGIMMLWGINMIYGQTLDITGSIVDASGAGATGCDVTLVNTGVKVSAGTDGSFNISDVMSIGSLANNTKFTYTEGTRLYFTSTSTNPVHITVKNANGRKVTDILNQRLSAGEYSIEPLAYIPAGSRSGVYYIKVDMGKYTSTNMMPYVGLSNSQKGLVKVHSSSAGSSGNNTSSSRKILSKTSAETDVLSISCNGIFQKSIDVTKDSKDLGKITVYGKPNLVFAYTDDQSYWESGAYGNPLIKMPVMDSLSKIGVSFKYAYSPSNICQPSRASVMLSQFAGTHRSGFDRPTILSISDAEFAKSYPVLLRKGGYKSAFMGKFGFGVTATKKQKRIL